MGKPTRLVLYALVVFAVLGAIEAVTGKWNAVINGGCIFLGSVGWNYFHARRIEQRGNDDDH
ncbi:hypothetical protein OG785_40620 [Streptomyces sp. NBC_00006]|uniref:hypothetical protein n=1 Tax=unclassified Streptomyces TaxID=2593676 RepID=UPI0022599E04|nr:MULTISPECIES: hypothetical protein [unclassified Streptomyces]MCX4832320.1 hypothetical protein [Streptomyces sp. NBC_01016]MCX4835944.1 hypothetical protein [Streptomyces sp. NBC_01016]MCX5536844.1 hypothetical protein [Streptomyces sp. NBC_00006]MCX5536855.1 hypothetical protein [Streptomyces sp. NBC_00006]